MQKGPEHTTKQWHDRHAKQLKHRKLRNRQLKIDRENFNPVRVADRRYRKAKAEMERFMANLKWYQRLFLRIRYWFKK